MPAIKRTSDQETLEYLAPAEFDEAAFQREAQKENLPGALALLPERQREVFVARAVERVPYSELADRFSMKESNVRLQYSRARKALEGLLGATDN